eukprot:1957528-Pleurochrysis_carterae.AAC.3
MHALCTAPHTLVARAAPPRPTTPHTAPPLARVPPPPGAAARAHNIHACQLAYVSYRKKVPIDIILRGMRQIRSRAYGSVSLSSHRRRLRQDARIMW